MKAWLLSLLVLASLSASGWVHAQSAWSAADYDLYPGDFNGDVLTDLLYISKDPSRPSGIVLSDGTGLNTSLQTWGNAYLGIPWTDGTYNIIVADFDGDGKADILLQRKTPGDSYLLLTEDGGVGAISQTIPYNAAGIVWTADQHQIVAGDFNGDGKADLFFQPVDSKGLSAVILADQYGQFTAKAPSQSWNDGYAGLNWASNEVLVYAGDFDGDGRSDLLVQAFPMPGTGPGTPMPAQFQPNSNGVLLAQSGKQLFTLVGLQAWSRDGFGADWSPLDSVVVVGDFNADGRSDVFLQGATSNNPNDLLYGHAPGPIFATGVALKSATVASADTYRLMVGQFTNDKGSGLYYQSLSTKQTNYLVRLSGGALVTTQSDASLPATTNLHASAAPSGPSLQAAMPVTAAGRTPGHFAVSATGAATYQIPIWTPPGIGKVVPSLSLSYNSRGPNGTLGLGWNISGLSIVARCNKTYSQDGAPGPVTLQRSTTYSDRFCLDGQQLKLTSGAGTYGYPNSTYATEIESFSSIRAGPASIGNGPAYFTVTTKNGLIYTFGGTTDSDIMAGSSGTVRVWALSQIADRLGNKISLVYQNDTTNGSYRIDHINYPITATGGGPYYTIYFSYGARPTTDILSSYNSGYLIKETNQLNSIVVRAISGSLIRQYNMGYTPGPTSGRDTLTLVQECSATQCLAPTTITYRAGATGWSSTPTSVVPIPSTTYLGSSDTFGDFNGDGRQDFVYSTYVSGTARHWWVILSSGAGYLSPIDLQLQTGVKPVPHIAHVRADTRDQLTISTTTFEFNGSGFTSQFAIGNSFADVDGDGLQDRVFSSGGFERNLTTPGGAITFGNSGTGYHAPTGWTITYSYYDRSHRVKAMDFNGDGRADFLVSLQPPGGAPLVWQPLITNGIDSAGNANPYTVGQTFTVASDPSFGQDTSIAQPIDWNGDGCTDIFQPDYVYVSDCVGGFTAYPIGAYTNGAYNPYYEAMDWNGDGRQDVVYVDRATGHAHVILSTGTAAGANIDIGSITPHVDVDGEGQYDLLTAGSYAWPYQATSGVLYNVYGHNSSGALPDQAASFTDGYGISDVVSYASLAAGGTLYNKLSTAVFPEQDYIGPLYVVSQVTESDGTGGTYNRQYHYDGGRLELQGRGFEGFASQRMYDSRTGVYSYSDFAQTFPFAGILLGRRMYQSNGTTPISTATGTPASQSFGSGYEVRYFTFLSGTSELQYEFPSGALVTQTTTTSTYGDGFGNPTLLVQSVTDKDSASPFYNSAWTTTIASTFSNTPSSNCLGIPTLTTMQNAVPGQLTQTKTFSATVDASACRVTQQVLEPGNTPLKVTTDFGFDGCGNTSSITVTGHNADGSAMSPASRTTSFDYNFQTGRCQLPEAITDALGNVTKPVYDYRYGSRTSSTDSNGLQTSWTLDEFGRVSAESRPDGTSTTWTYLVCNGGNNYCGVGDLRLQVVEQERDSLGVNVRQVITDFDGLVRGRFVESQHSVSAGSLTVDEQMVYDNLGRLIRRYQPYKSSSNGYYRWTYDSLGRKTAEMIYQPNGTLDRTTTFGYTGRTVSITDPLSHVTAQIVDVTQHIRRITDPAPGGTTQFDYDAFGNLNQTIDAGGATSSATFNLRGFRTQMVDADAGTWNFTGDSLNEVTSWTDAKGQTFSEAYDAIGRIVSRTEPEGTSTWNWGTSISAHNIGQLSSMSGYGYSENMTYDGIGRLASRTIVTDQSYQFDYTYNSIGKLGTVAYPTSPVPTGTLGNRFTIQYDYSYGDPYRIQDITNAARTLWTLNAANDYASSTSETLGAPGSASSVTVLTGYKVWTNEVLSLQAGTGSATATIQNLAFLWDTAGNLLQRGDGNQSGTCSFTVGGGTGTSSTATSKLCEAFTFDPLNRLSTSTLNSNQNLSIGYGASGNIVSRSDVGSYTYPTPPTLRPHAVTGAGSNSYSYDANGNMTVRNGQTQTWASYNLPIILKSVVGGSTLTSQQFYGPTHEPWKQIATDTNGIETTFYVGDRSLEKATASTTGLSYWKHYITTPSGRTIIVNRNSDGSSSTSYLLTDNLGSSSSLVDGGSGNSLLTESFDSFGARRQTNWTAGVPAWVNQVAQAQSTRRGFTGHEHLDSVGLIHMKGRVYDPVVGRFLSVDPVAGNPIRPQAQNPYSYVENRPLVLIDPTGLAPDHCGRICPTFGASELGGDLASLIPDSNAMDIVPASEVSPGMIVVGEVQKADAQSQTSAQGSTNANSPISERPSVAGGPGGTLPEVVITATLRRAILLEHFAKRAVIYSEVDAALRANHFARQTHFFAGAASVNMNLAASTSVENVSLETLSYLDALGASLEDNNLQWFVELTIGQLPANVHPQGTSERMLDYAMVVSEQHLVTIFTHNYFRNNSSGYANARTEINFVMNNPVTSYFLRSTMRRQGILPFDYGSERHRILLGQGLMDREGRQ